ncbi:MAG: hypothetical protein IV107_25055 [Paucibacter sp.]|nr:hypothetical protein [Roseateles sp.]
MFHDDELQKLNGKKSAAPTRADHGGMPGQGNTPALNKMARLLKRDSAISFDFDLRCQSMKLHLPFKRPRLKTDLKAGLKTTCPKFRGSRIPVC